MKIKVLVVCVFAVSALLLVSWAYSHCHNDGLGPEDPGRVRGDYKWPDSRKIPSTHIYQIPWFLNPDYPNKPSLSPDAGNAASAWSSIRFRGKIINFQFQYKQGDTEDKSAKNNNDNVNLVAYESFPQNSIYLALCYRRPLTGHKIAEFDIAVNYYKPFKQHSWSGWPDSSKACIKEVLTHEFGHAAGLEDVYYFSSRANAPDNSPDYAHYTMNGWSDPLGTHWRESLNCEDKYALETKYGSRNP